MIKRLSIVAITILGIIFVPYFVNKIPCLSSLLPKQHTIFLNWANGFFEVLFGGIFIGIILAIIYIFYAIIDWVING